MKAEVSKLVEIKECKKTRIAIKFKIKAIKRILDMPEQGSVSWMTGLRTEFREEKDKVM